MKKEHSADTAPEQAKKDGDISPIALGDVVKRDCPVCGPDRLFKVCPGYRAVCRECGFEIHLS